MKLIKELREYLEGTLVVILLSGLAYLVAEIQVVKHLSISPLIIGIVLGMVYANTISRFMPKTLAPGITFCSKRILRLAIILYGFRLTLQHVVAIGWSAVAIDLIVVSVVILVGVLLGKLLKMDKEITLLTSIGSAICGAAAVLGAESVLANKPYKTAVAVSTVVIFGTIAMFLYPALYYLDIGLTDNQWGVYVGATVHEVAHVVGAGKAISESVGATAIIVKMIRVILLAPVLLILSLFVTKSNTSSSKLGMIKNLKIPWFAIWFIVVILFNSLSLLPTTVVDSINTADTFLLTMAMTALGMGTTFSQFKAAGFKPFILAFVLFGILLGGGYALVWLMI